MNRALITLVLICCFANPLYSQDQQSDDGFVPLFNGKDLSGWQRVNTAESTWSVKDGLLICTGKPIGELRTTRMYQNFIMEIEWRHLKPRGNAGIFVWADDLTAKGVPFHRSIEVQVLENAYGNTKGYTTHGDIFPIHGAKMKPINGRGGSRAFPTENRSKPSPQWNHYRIECRDGEISLAVNGKVVTKGKECFPRKGYICLESEGGVVHYRNAKIKELPGSPLKPEHVAIKDRGFVCLYNGIDLKNWKSPTGDWTPNDWRLVHKGSKGTLTSNQEYGDTSFIVDFRGSKLPLFQFRGTEIKLDNSLVPKGNGWNRVQIDAKGGQVTLSVNGKKSEQLFKTTAEQSALTIHVNGDCELANIYVKK